MRQLNLLICFALCVSLAACTPANAPGVVHAAIQETGTPSPVRTPLDTGSLAPATPWPSLTPASAAKTAALPRAALVTPEPAASATPQPPATVTNPPPSPTPTPCADTTGIVASISLTPTTLHYALDARVYLPPCYGASDERYPVLYLMHGLNNTNNQWVQLGVITATNTLIGAGEIAPLIIVMPSDRLDDRLDRAFVVDLIPYIDRTYRTLAGREHRAIGGMSRGAGWALHLGLHYPDLFGRIGAHSPAVFYGDETNLTNWTAHLPRQLTPEIYIDIGNEDSLTHSAAWLDQIFTWFKIKHTYLVQPGAHIASYWTAHLADYLRFYAAGWRDLPAPTATPQWAGHP
jgi:enterochelin esterase-like enzyme